MCLGATSMSSLDKCLCRSYADFPTGSFVFLVFDLPMLLKYSVDLSFFSCFTAIIFSHSEGYLFHLVYSFLSCAKTSN